MNFFVPLFKLFFYPHKSWGIFDKHKREIGDGLKWLIVIACFVSACTTTYLLKYGDSVSMGMFSTRTCILRVAISLIFMILSVYFIAPYFLLFVAKSFKQNVSISEMRAFISVVVSGGLLSSLLMILFQSLGIDFISILSNLLIRLYIFGISVHLVGCRFKIGLLGSFIVICNALFPILFAVMSVSTLLIYDEMISLSL